MGSIDIPTLQQYLTLIKDFFTMLSAIAVGGVAILGLQAWKKQLKGKTEFETARNLLRAVYKVRNAVREYRFIFADGSEITQALQEANVEVEASDPEFHAKSQQALYQKRWKRISETYSEMDLSAFEAEVIWGNEAIEKLLPLRRIIAELNSYTSQYLRNLVKPFRQGLSVEMTKKIYDVLYGVPFEIDEENKNPFTTKIEEAITQIESFIKPKLKL
jgi:hypothetical protein